MKRIIGLMAVVAVLALTGAAMAEDNWHSGAYDEQRGTNFADPNGYKRFIQYQGAGDAGAGDAGSGDAGAAAGSTGGDSGGNGDGNGDGCGSR